MFVVEKMMGLMVREELFRTIYRISSLKIKEKLIFIWQQNELKYYHGKYYWQRTVTIIWQLVN